MKLRRLGLHILAIGMLITSGCATVTEAGYYWGNYSSTLYAYTKSPSEETLQLHLDELESIVEESRERDLRVPGSTLKSATSGLSLVRTRLLCPITRRR